MRLVCLAFVCRLPCLVGLAGLPCPPGTTDFHHPSECIDISACGSGVFAFSCGHGLGGEQTTCSQCSRAARIPYAAIDRPGGEVLHCFSVHDEARNQAPKGFRAYRRNRFHPRTKKNSVRQLLPTQLCRCCWGDRLDFKRESGIENQRRERRFLPLSCVLCRAVPCSAVVLC